MTVRDSAARELGLEAEAVYAKMGIPLQPQDRRGPKEEFPS
jgi:hypothetical protein